MTITPELTPCCVVFIFLLTHCKLAAFSEAGSALKTWKIAAGCDFVFTCSYRCVFVWQQRGLGFWFVSAPTVLSYVQHERKGGGLRMKKRKKQRAFSLWPPCVHLAFTRGDWDECVKSHSDTWVQVEPGKIRNYISLIWFRRFSIWYILSVNLCIKTTLKCFPLPYLNTDRIRCISYQHQKCNSRL